MSRPSRRSAGGADPMTPIASVSRGPPSSSSRSPQSMRLTVKLPAGKLREATRTSTGSIAVNSRDPFAGGEILEGRRARNVKKSYVLPESDEDEEDEEEEDDEMEDLGDEDAEGEEDDQEMDDVSDDDADGDIDMDIPPAPTIKVSKAQTGKQTIVVKPSGKSDGKSVERKEAEVSDDDEELSDIDSPAEEDDDDQQEVGDEDADGDEEDEEIVLEEEEDEENPFGSDDEDTPVAGSRGSTPDINKMTKRQRAKLEEGANDFLMALPDEVQVKKHLTAEEHAMRRAEMARRRKNLSEKRNEEEKMETINKLLKKQAPKTNARRRDFAGATTGDAIPEIEVVKPNPIFVRWVSGKDGNRIGVPEEWLDGPAGAIFGKSIKATGTLKAGSLVEEV
ncbi:hypothetical protein BP5796_06506 [Coleophoma crateriformis]|uniref:INO80 complex subunit B-like conserved region domain-containing protein n=1 Tax=Coleophoma crateriformis TaxID=565419 RepID=A0A3D8RNV2_9HELO|nr:hypothetical protein BP5796_06506 [Coleophoma crateriformis]